MSWINNVKCVQEKSGFISKTKVQCPFLKCCKNKKLKKWQFGLCWRNFIMNKKITLWTIPFTCEMWLIGGGGKGMGVINLVDLHFRLVVFFIHILYRSRVLEHPHFSSFYWNLSSLMFKWTLKLKHRTNIQLQIKK